MNWMYIHGNPVLLESDVPNSPRVGVGSPVTFLNGNQIYGGVVESCSDPQGMYYVDVETPPDRKGWKLSVPSDKVRRAESVVADIARTRPIRQDIYVSSKHPDYASKYDPFHSYFMQAVKALAHDRGGSGHAIGVAGRAYAAHLLRAIARSIFASLRAYPSQLGRTIAYAEAYRGYYTRLGVSMDRAASTTDDDMDALSKLLLAPYDLTFAPVPFDIYLSYPHAEEVRQDLFELASEYVARLLELKRQRPMLPNEGGSLDDRFGHLLQINRLTREYSDELYETIAIQSSALTWAPSAMPAELPVLGDAFQKLGQLVDPSVVRFDDLSFSLLDPNLYSVWDSHYSKAEATIYLHPGVDFPTVVHLLGHALVAYNPYLRAVSYEFYRGRTYGTGKWSLAALTGDDSIPPEIETKAGCFLRPSLLIGEGSEIIPTALQWMATPAQSMPFLVGDGAMFSFALSAVSGGL